VVQEHNVVKFLVYRLDLFRDRGWSRFGSVERKRFTYVHWRSIIERCWRKFGNVERKCFVDKRLNWCRIS